MSSEVRAVPLLRAPRVPATVTYRAVWHKEYRRGKELAALRPDRRNLNPAPAAPARIEER